MADTTKQKVLELAPELSNIIRNTRQLDTATVNTALDKVYTLTINNSDFTYTASGDTIETIALELVSAINLGTEPVTAIDNLDGSFYIRSNDAGVRFFSNVDIEPYIDLQTTTYPQLGESLFNRLLEDAKLAITEVQFKSEEEVAQRYWIAHKITLISAANNEGIASDGDSGTPSSGALTREKVGDVELWYSDSGSATAGVTEAEFGLTTYGKMYLSMRDRHKVYFV